MSSPTAANILIQFSSNKSVAKQLKVKVSEFLASPKNANHLVEIIDYLKDSTARNAPITPMLLSLETIFTELLRRNEMRIEVQPLKPVEESPEVCHKQWLQSQYKESFSAILEAFNHEKSAESVTALVTAMRLITIETENPIDNGSGEAHLPLTKLKHVMLAILSSERANTHLVNRFMEYASYLDIIYFCWKIIPSLAPKEFSPNTVFVQNFLSLIGAVSFGKDLIEDSTSGYLCIQMQHLDYPYVRKQINKTWSCVMNWKHDEVTHRQLLILLLEKILPHLDKPMLLTDFLMDSLDVGGAISMLALQGIFVMIQQHNLTYPNIYEKLYSMFEPEIFHTKFKARLFYLADIFLSSSHLPEGLVAAFAKRLARLALIAPPQDIVIILRFIGNLIMRHPALKRLIFHPSGGEVSQDPFIMDECDPVKSNALESCLWEIATLQSHVLPSVATAAKFISNPLPSVEWDLASVLEINESDIFDKEIAKKSKEFALLIDRPTSMFLSCGGERTSQYWKLF
ncbi:nucleolar complex protein 4 homolog A [Toxorhynchites rutilus septentrionalis]|uniref:nucleolar complex protein 4 homolog A n=1 Tax=Toxorhynchites rutilus septentrionalis TaxID=329112 RepID=UPI00247A25A9|nr:nucleolar complex protein 4 homolog A [Toxorhynchites rutilus septentrionalis]